MDEFFIALILLLLIASLGGGVILGIIALIKIGGVRREIPLIERALQKLSDRLARLEKGAPAETAPAETVTPTPQVPPPRATPVEPARPGSTPVGPARILPAVGELRSEGWRDLEKRIGQRWMVWAGALVLIIATAAFAKYSFEHGWIGPTARIVMGIILGIVFLVVGDRFARRKYRALAQGLMGTGIAVLYVVLFTGFSWYDLFPQSVAFASMVLVTAAGMTLAILHDAQPVALIAVLGGMLTPVLVSTGKDSRDVLFGYILLLDLGVLMVAFFKKWRWLDVVAFVGTVSLYIGWYDKFYTPKAMVPALLWLGAFYLVFLLLPFIYHLRRREEVPWTRFIMALANAIFVFTTAYVILREDYQSVAGFIALGMTACYAVMGVLTRRRVPGGFKQVLAFLALATAFLAIAAPLHFKVNGIILAWAVEAPVLLFLGYRYRYLPLRLMAFALMCGVSVYCLAAAWPKHDALFTLIWNRKFLTALAVPLAAGVFALLHWKERAHATELDGHAGGLAACGAGLLAMIFLTAELNQWLYYASRLGEWKNVLLYLRCVSVVVWTVGALIYSLVGLRLTSKKARLTGLGTLIVSIIMVGILLAWRPRSQYILFLNLRFIICLVNVATLFALAALSRRRSIDSPEERSVARALTSVAGFLLLVVLSVEVYHFSRNLIENNQSARWLARMSVSVVWGLYAFVALGIGIRKRLAPLRYAALALFGVTVLKVLLFDTSQIKDIYRWIVLYATGFLLIGGSYLYYKLEKSLAPPTQEDAQ